MFNKVLLAVDGTGRSREMMNMLLQMPSMQRSQVNVLHVIPVPATAEGLTEYRLAGERTLDKEVQSLNLKPENLPVKILKEGEPKDIVCQVADALKPDLLIMGSRGLGRLQAILANSVSQYVFQLASVPMLLVKDDVYIKSIRKIAVAVNNSLSSEQALDLAIALVSGSQDAEIVLLRVVKKRDEAANSEPDSALAKATAKLIRLNITHRALLRAGDQGKEICKAVEEVNASLLILGSPEHRPSIAMSLPDLDRLLGNSISDYVRVNATCPVLLTRSQSE